MKLRSAGLDAGLWRSRYTGSISSPPKGVKRVKNLVYRFRSLERLVATGDDPGELEKLEIFFSAPSQLNDPLEGYKDIFWAGDSIVWQNLFKHYITCLVQHCFVHLLSIGSDQPSDCTVLIRNHCDGLPPGVSDLIDAVQAKALGYKEVVGYVNALADFREVRLQALIFHFKVLHRIALHTALSEMESRRLLPFSTRDIVDSLSKDLQTCEETANGYLSDPTNEFDETIYEKADGYMLAAKLEHGSDKLHESWFFLMAEFPEAFCKSLEDLTHTKWYTACFMDDCTNSSVWGSYGANHTGVCLIYDAPLSENGKPTLKVRVPVGRGSHGIIKDVIPLELHKVDYERQFAKIDFFNSLGSLPVPTLNRFWYTDGKGGRSQCAMHLGSDEWRRDYWQSVIDTNTTKLKDWSFEREYRAILLPSVLDLTNSDSRKCSYDFDSLTGIIFGIKTPDAQKIRIIQILRELCKRHGRSGFDIYQARYNPSEKKITHHRVAVDI